MNLKTQIGWSVLLIFVTMAPVFSIADTTSLAGKWKSVDYLIDGGGDGPWFSMSFKRKGRDITGAYCYIAQSGNRIDCDPGGDSNVGGRVSADRRSAIVDFYSFFGATGGRAEIKLDGEYLVWRVLKLPEGGDYYVPLNAKMFRDISSELHPGERVVVVDKAFFYKEPDIRSKGRAYVVKGDYLKLLKISPDFKFWKVRFDAGNGRRSIVWVECSAIDSCVK
ncbi:hypothetical protein AB4851_17015 [Burkholderia sp. 22PA0099]|uniref:hypothetical protein n=1 Tax=Burkholderia sp. 22PA0099 TaxID=3237372 RepID=UPI0039C1C4B3